MGKILDILHARGVHDYFPFVPRPPARFVNAQGVEVHGVLAEFDTPAAVYHAAIRVRDAGFVRWDVHSPFPIHGIEEAMGFGKTKLPIVVACGAFTGTFLAWLMQYWMSAVDYPLVVQGKPPEAWEPMVPIMFEISVLLAAFTALLTMLAMNGLPRFYHPLFKKDRFLRMSQDRFGIAIDAADPKFEPARVREILAGAGATHIELVEI
jgi:hypothetical protein